MSEIVKTDRSIQNNQNGWVLDLLDRLEDRFDKPLDELSIGLCDGFFVLRQPLAATAWTLKQSVAACRTVIKRKWGQIPRERQVAPEARLLNLVIDGMTLCNQHSELRAMFENLLSTSIDKDSAENAHPGFAEIIKQLLPDEAKIVDWLGRQPYGQAPVLRVYEVHQSSDCEYRILKTIRADRITNIPTDAGCQSVSAWDLYSENLARLHLISFDDRHYLAGHPGYPRLKDLDAIKELSDQFLKKGSGIETAEYLVGLTEFGRRFHFACVLPNSELENSH